MFDPQELMMFELLEHRRITANSDRVGYVQEINKDKIRVCMGYHKDGSPWLTPWLHTTDHRGGTRERDVYAVGQSVRVSAPGGDFRQATITPWAESQPYPAPAHADNYVKNNVPYAKTGQHGQLRWSVIGPQPQSNSGGSGGGTSFEEDDASSGDIAFEFWVSDSDDGAPQWQQPSGQPTASTSAVQPTQQQQLKPGNPTMKLRVSQNGYITGRVGSNIRFAAHSSGAKIKAGSHFVIATPQHLILSDPPIISTDPIPDDNS